MKFKKATKSQAKLRLALVGVSGSGKTYTALTIAAALGEPVAVIDTERGSASKYAGDVAHFDALELETYAPRTYVQAIAAAASQRYPVLVIDSLSHAWMGEGGALEMVDKAAARSKSGNTFMAWRDVTPEHNALVSAILGYPGHVIVTMRAKSEYVIEEDGRGKKTPRKIGMAPVQRDGLEYEFDVVADLDTEHRMVVTKSRCSALADAVIVRPGREVADRLRAWLDDGVQPAPREERAPMAESAPAAAPAAKPAGVPPVADCRDADELQAWCRGAGGELLRTLRGRQQSAGITRIMQHAERIGVGAESVWQWLDLPVESAAEGA
jgi:hypothetical protein